MDKQLLSELSTSSVLYVEDEPSLQKQMSEMLDIIFSKVYLASNGEEALEKQALFRPELIITDLEMPKMDGLNFVKKLRSFGDNTPVIILSAHTKTDYLLEAVELALVRYIVKPLTEKKLTQALEKFITIRQKPNHKRVAPGWFVNFSTNKIHSPKAVFDLTKKESAMLELLLSKGTICSYSEIEEHVWQDESMSLNALRLLMKNLRKKLPEGTLKNIQGVGYSL